MITTESLVDMRHLIWIKKRNKEKYMIFPLWWELFVFILLTTFQYIMCHFKNLLIKKWDTIVPNNKRKSQSMWVF